jgi:hypothetical protein
MNSNADSISKADANKPDDKFFTSQDFLKFLEEQGISKMLVQTKDGKNISALFHSTDSMDPALFKSIESLGSLGDLTSDKNGSGEAKTFVEVSTFVSKEGEGTGGGGGGAGEERSSKHQDWMKSTEWVRDLRKDHVDVSYSQIFAKSTSGQDEQAAEKPSGAGTNAKNGQSLPPKKRTSSMMSASSEEDVLDSAKVGGAASSSAAAAANPSQILGMGATLPSGSAGKTDWNAMYQMAMYQNALQQTMLQRNVMQRNFVAMMGRQGMSNGGSANGNLQPGPGPNELSSNPAVTSAAAASASARTNPKTAPVALDSSALGLPAKGDAAGCTTSTAAPATAGSDGSAHGNTASLPLLVEAALRAQMAPVVEDTKKKVKKQASKSSASSDSKHRKPRKIIPDVKEYVDNFTDYDVLFGRGGRSNHHVSAILVYVVLIVYVCTYVHTMHYPFSRTSRWYIVSLHQQYLSITMIF